VRALLGAGAGLASLDANGGQPKLSMRQRVAMARGGAGSGGGGGGSNINGPGNREHATSPNALRSVAAEGPPHAGAVAEPAAVPEVLALGEGALEPAESPVSGSELPEATSGAESDHDNGDGDATESEHQEGDGDATESEHEEGDGGAT
jgi:hypothetical protein